MLRLHFSSTKEKYLSVIIICLLLALIISIWHNHSYDQPRDPLMVEQNDTTLNSITTSGRATTERKIDKGLTFPCGYGQLGNKMFFYSIIYGLANLNNRNGYIQKCNANTCRYNELDCQLESLDKIFYVTLPVGPDLPQAEYHGHDIKFHITYPNDYHISPEANILTGEIYPISVTYFLHVRDQIRREFRFRKLHEAYATSVIQPIKEKHQNATLVGVHVRRGNFLEHLKSFNKTVASSNFFHYAMQYFRTLIPSPLFIVLSDDIPWCRKNIVGDDVVIVQEMSSAANDLAVLSLCQHTIFDYGTYGFWAAFLAGGKAVYYKDGIVDTSDTKDISPEKMYPSDWVGISEAMMNITT